MEILSTVSRHSFSKPFRCSNCAHSHPSKCNEGNLVPTEPLSISYLCLLDSFFLIDVLAAWIWFCCSGAVGEVLQCFLQFSLLCLVGDFIIDLQTAWEKALVIRCWFSFIELTNYIRLRLKLKFK